MLIVLLVFVYFFAYRRGCPTLPLHLLPPGKGYFAPSAGNFWPCLPFILGRKNTGLAWMRTFGANQPWLLNNNRTAWHR
jgi:hypothetical protein